MADVNFSLCYSCWDGAVRHDWELRCRSGGLQRGEKELFSLWFICNSVPSRLTFRRSTWRNSTLINM